MVNKVTTATVIGLDAYNVSVETDVLNGLPAFSIVGLPDTAINEARDRVRSAIRNSGFTFPIIIFASCTCSFVTSASRQ